MVTLRERKPQYGIIIIINLPTDRTAATTNKAIAAAFKTLPAHLKSIRTTMSDVSAQK